MTDIKNEYIKRLSENIDVEQKNGYQKITTPFLDTSNDHIEIYAQFLWGWKIILSDDCFTVNFLFSYWFEISSPKRQSVFDRLLRIHWVSYNSSTSEMYIETDAQNVWRKKHNLIQAITSVCDMLNSRRSSPWSTKLFKDDIKSYLYDEWLSFSIDVNIKGKSGFEHNVDFLFTWSKTKPEKIVKVSNRVERANVDSSLFTFSEIDQVRENNTQSVFVYNSWIYWIIKPEYKSAFEKYGVNVFWSLNEDRKQLVSFLAK